MSLLRMKLFVLVSCSVSLCLALPAQTPGQPVAGQRATQTVKTRDGKFLGLPVPFPFPVPFPTGILKLSGALPAALPQAVLNALSSNTVPVYFDIPGFTVPIPEALLQG